ncbi:MAG: TRAFs-binding domain-containing protein [Isosphaeraceae bacterium]
MPPHVSWTRRAEQRCSAALQGEPELALACDDQAELVRRLQTAFADAIDVVVLNYHVGFKKRPGEHILRVDVHRPHAANTYVVKLAGSDRLARERDAWAQCGLSDTNPVFMPLLAVPDPLDAGRLCALAYQDAEAHIGSESTVWFETAVQHSVRFNRPTVESIRSVLRDVYAQTTRLYESARLQAARSVGIETMPIREQPSGRHQLGGTLELWNRSPAMAIRRRVDAAFHIGFAGFVDPVDYFVFLAGEQPKASILPEQLRGLAHGDLHGRNVLVGIDEREAANFPSLFDYEHIHRDNLVGWDFAEMETELKIRCYEHVFPNLDEASRARRIQQFEWRLMEATRHAHETNHWSDDAAAALTAEGRLFSILLGVRQEAHAILSRPRAGSIEWLDEYLFLLGAYGLTTVRYENQPPLERTAAYISAGVAAAFWENLCGPRAAPPADLAALPDWPCPGYHVLLTVAHRWNRGDDCEREQAEQLLSSLIKRYPAALHVWFEWAFNRAKHGRFDEALKAVKKIHETFGDAMGEDAYSLWGRCYKEAGDRHLESGRRCERGSAEQRSSFEDADDAYILAVARYRQAYEVEGGFFPGINLATLLFLRAGLSACLDRPAEAASLRQQSSDQAVTLGQSKFPEKLPDDNIWRRATQAEAAILRRDWNYAALRYRSALDQENRQAHHPASMGHQLRRLIEAYGLFGETVPREPFLKVPELLTYFPEETTT